MVWSWRVPEQQSCSHVTFLPQNHNQSRVPIDTGKQSVVMPARSQPSRGGSAVPAWGWVLPGPDTEGHSSVTSCFIASGTTRCTQWWSKEARVMDSLWCALLARRFWR
ncbi:hypothetical protein E2C01_036086 [Portunus trituberculatus]|uniref:Uncharacterized protein n=1 Tax=Portunus trituberculatus TaxID=210409 RepID=A0A5B7FD88_PORTR|nr:hypothetical protein [Portunus trituberculatus]